MSKTATAHVEGDGFSGLGEFLPKSPPSTEKLCKNGGGGPLCGHHSGKKCISERESFH